MANPAISNTDSSQVAAANNRFARVTLALGENVVAGEMLGVVTLSGEYATLDSVKVDGAQLARAVAYEDKDATAAALGIKVIIAGDLDDSKLVFSNVGDTLATVPAGSADSYALQLRDFGMYANTYYNVYQQDNS